MRRTSTAKRKLGEVTEDIFEEIVRIKGTGGQAALATIISTTGSTPREIGSKMLIRSDGTILGSMGGGSAEAEVCQVAMKVILEGKPKVLHFDLTGREAVEEGMICGGIMDVFIEPITFSPTLFIFGGGHISLSLAKMGKLAGFRVVVLDDRPEFACRERFPEVDEIYAQDFSTVFPELMIDDSSYIVIVTRGHLSDEKVLDWAVQTRARYIGMLGSRKKNETVFSHLRSRRVSEELIGRVNAPIGLEIGAETPEEISVSILAEVIKVRRAAGKPFSTPEGERKLK